MFQKSILSLMFILFFNISFMYAGCGSCPGDVKAVKKEHIKKTKDNTLVMSIPESGEISGLVITSCGKCNLGTKDRGCSLSVKIGEKIYPVKGTSIHDHGDAHGNDGFCSAVRVAWASGIIKKDVFSADSFVLVGNSK